MKPLLELTPRQIVSELDQHVIGQKDAKRAVAIALRNRYRRKRVEGEMREEILPNNILMIGPTGVGKTEIARRLAKLAGAPFIKVEASKYTEVGYVGRDVEGMIRDLVEMAVSMVRDEFSDEVQITAQKRVEEKLLDLLLPPPPKARARKETPVTISSMLESAFQPTESDDDEDDSEAEADPEVGDSPDVDEDDGAESGKTAPDAGQERYQRTREKFRKRLQDGKLEDAEIEVKLPDRGAGNMVQVFGPMGMEEMGMNLQEILGPMMPRKKRSRRLPVSEARELLLNEEIERLLDMDAVVSEALDRVEEMGIVIIDEIDKIVGPDEGGSGPDVSREGVQRDILPIVEGTRVQTKYGPVQTEHILFIAAGAFHVAKPSDLIPELQGRFPIRVELDALGRKEFVKILTQPRSALVKQYQALLATENVTLEFEKSALTAIAQIAEELNETTENIGARRLHTVLSTLLEELMFKVPSRNIKKVTLTSKDVHGALDDLIEDEDLSRYIL